MTSEENSAGRGANPAGARKASTANAHDMGPGVPRVVGEWHPPAGRRTLGVVLVRHCPHCRHLHVHRAGAAKNADGAIRTGSCGRPYKIALQQPAARLGEAA